MCVWFLLHGREDGMMVKRHKYIKYFNFMTLHELTRRTCNQVVSGGVIFLSSVSGPKPYYLILPGSCLYENKQDIVLILMEKSKVDTSMQKFLNICS